MSGQPITNVEDAVAALGALPVPSGPEPRNAEEELTGANLSLWEEEQTTARLRLALASAQRGRRDLRQLVQQMCDALNGHECPPLGELPMTAVTRVAVRLMEAERQVAELERVIAEAPASYVLMDRVRAAADRLTRTFAPTQALREDDEFHLHHTYRTGRDLPGPDGVE